MITGASSGIGLATAKLAAERGAKVVLAAVNRRLCKLLTNARNYMDKEPKLPSPLDDPEDVAKAILDAAVKPTRTKKFGGMSKINTATAKLTPNLGDKMAAKQATRQQYEEPPRHPEGTLGQPGELVGTVGQVHGSGGREPKE